MGKTSGETKTKMENQLFTKIKKGEGRVDIIYWLSLGGFPRSERVPAEGRLRGKRKKGCHKE